MALTIRFKIPFIGDQDASSREAMMFHKWLPIDKKDNLSIDLEFGKLTFWFDVKSTWWASQPDEEEIRKWVNITAHYIYADLVIHDYENDLINFILSPDTFPDEIKKEMFERSKKWGIEILNSVLFYFNRLISFTRSIKGQFWLHEYPLDEDYFLKFEAKGKIGNGKWFRFDPIINKSFTIIMSSTYERFFDEESWEEANDFVKSNSQPDFYLNLLSEAESFRSKGNNRVALTEVVSALEVMVYKFANDERNTSYLPDDLLRRMGMDSISRVIKHLGLTATINYLFPLIFNEEQIPVNILKDCQAAIRDRGNVVHRGQRDVDPKKIGNYIQSIRHICDFLDKCQ